MRTEEEIRSKIEVLYDAYHKLTEEMKPSEKKPFAKEARDIVNTKIGMLEWVLNE